MRAYLDVDARLAQIAAVERTLGNDLRPCRILEVGSGMGMLVAVATKLGLDIVGCEPAANAYAHLGAAGGRPDEGERRVATVDQRVRGRAATMGGRYIRRGLELQVLEHVVAPAKMLAAEAMRVLAGRPPLLRGAEPPVADRRTRESRGNGPGQQQAAGEGVRGDAGPQPCLSRRAQSHDADTCTTMDVTACVHVRRRMPVSAGRGRAPVRRACRWLAMTPECPRNALHGRCGARAACHATSADTAVGRAPWALRASF